MQQNQVCMQQHSTGDEMHALVSGYKCYYCCMPSYPMLLHIYLVLLHVLIPCVAAYILPLFLYFLALSSLATSFNILYFIHYIRESVDSLCRDSTDRPINPICNKMITISNYSSLKVSYTFFEVVYSHAWYVVSMT